MNLTCPVRDRAVSVPVIQSLTSSMDEEEEEEEEEKMVLGHLK